MTATLRHSIKPGLSAVPDPIVADMYFRLSDLRDEDMNEDGSGKTQKYREQKLREFIDRLGFIPGIVIVENDEIEKARTFKGTTTVRKVRGASAFKRKKIVLPDGTVGMRVYRPGFRKILERLNTGQSHALVAEDLDRVMRDQYDAEDLLAIVERRHANTRSLTGTGTLTNGGTPDEQFMVRMYVNIANKSSADTARRVAASRERRALAGEYGGGRRPFGFDFNPGTKRLVKRADECDVIADYSRRVLQIDGRSHKPKWSLRALAAELRKHDVPTVTGAAWTPETLRDILLRPINANVSSYKGGLFEGVTCYDGKPVVPRDVYDAVVTLLEDPSRQCGPGSAPKYIGTNLYRCGLCTPPGTEPVGTKTMHVNASRGAYRCSLSGHLSCHQPELDALVVSHVLSLLSLPGAADLFVPAQPDVDVDGLRTEADAIRVKLDELATMFADDLLDASQVALATKKLKTRLEAINTELMSTVADSPLAGIAATGVDVVAWWKALPLPNKRLVVDTIMTVTVMPPTKYRGFDPDRVIIEPKNTRIAVAT